MARLALLYVPVPDDSTARTLTSTLLQERLAACVNTLPPMKSAYWWMGKIEDSAEIPLLVKTTDLLVDKVRARILELHPYETACVIELPVTSVNAEYLAWAEESVSKA